METFVINNNNPLICKDAINSNANSFGKKP